MMLRGLLYDTPEYFHALNWLGKPQASDHFAYVLRELPWGDIDARGSWPYQTFPDDAHIDKLTSGILFDGVKPLIPLTWTGVIRPDFPVDELNQRLLNLKNRHRVHCTPLKSHLGHLPGVSPAHKSFSARTRRRLSLAEKTFFVDVGSSLTEIYEALGAWQDELRVERGIPRCSSPDQDHFAGLHRIAIKTPECLLAIELRRRSDRALRAAFLLTKESGRNTSWHAHSLLSREDARRCFGTYLLFVAVIDHLGCDPIWWGGQPAGLNGPGVFRFKQRFSNASAYAHLVSIDLHPERLRAVRASYPLHAWLPDYRDPQEEMKR
ncbi:MAG TPA: hypothetical protein PK090_06705 [Smithellaceae bacterium]|nr:hypothetical protein [Smithellaceae bacterium]